MNIDPFLKRIEELKNLSNNWDGYNAIAPDIKAINRAIAFINRLNDRKPHLLKYLYDDEIYPMPYGTIIMNFMRERDNKCFSLEIGNTKSDYIVY